MAKGVRTTAHAIMGLALGASLVSWAIAAPAPEGETGPSLELARGLIDAERFEQAVVVLKGLDETGSTPQTALLMGRIYLALGKPGKALELFEQASFRSLDNEAEAYLGLAEARLALGDLAKARGEATRSLRSDPDLLPAHLVLASIDQRLGRSDEAKERLHRLRQDRPDSEDVAVILARYLAQQDGPPAAVAELSAFVRRHPTSAVAHDHLGNFLWATGRKAEAIEARMAEVAPEIRTVC